MVYCAPLSVQMVIVIMQPVTVNVLVLQTDMEGPDVTSSVLITVVQKGVIRTGYGNITTINSGTLNV